MGRWVILVEVILGLVILGCITWGWEKPLTCPHQDLNVCQLDQARCGAIAALQTAGKNLTGIEYAKAFDKEMRACLKSADWKPENKSK